MKYSYLLLLSLISSIACEQQKADPDPKPEEDPDWIKLEIPGGRVSNSVTGDLDGTLLMAAYTRTYYSTDRGKTWQESREFTTLHMALLTRNDTTFLFRGTRTTEDGKEFASMADYITTDYGKTWQYNRDYYGTLHTLLKTRGLAKASDGTTYTAKRKYTSIISDSILSEIIRSNSFGQQRIRFPFKYEITDLYLDSQNRLYVTGEGYFNAQNQIACCPVNTPAIIYVSRKPLP